MAKVPRPIRIEGDVAYVPLTKGYEAVIDASDAPLAAGTPWTSLEIRRKDGSLRAVYARRTIYQPDRPPQTEYLHRVISGADGHEFVDHRDRDGLNCRRANLRPATNAENVQNCARPAHNTSGVKGVSWDRALEKWQARIQVRGEKRYLGHFRCITAAALAYAKASRALHGDFGRVA